MIVAFAGKAGSGKNTSADILAKNFNNVQMVSFAEPIKRMLQLMYDISDEVLFGESNLRDTVYPKYRKDASFWDIVEYLQTFDSYNFESSEQFAKDFRELAYSDEKLSVRNLLRIAGQGMREKHGNDFWINLFLNKTIEHLKNNSDIVIVTDVRHRNEVLAVKQLGGINVKIKKTNQVNKSNHISETELDTIPDYWFDYMLVNDTSKNALENKINTLANEIKVVKLL